jgi:DNA-binding MarR family transcriptional regulator
VKGRALMAVRRLDTLLALKAVSLALGLKENDRRVAATLVEHFNRETSQCDPGLKRIADLLGISTRTVIRSTKRLETAGLLRKVRHGGHLNRNHYEPVWSRFREIEAEWRARFARTAQSGVTELSPAKCQPCHIGGDSPVTQTSRSNLLKETCSKESPRKVLIEKAPYSLSSSSAVGTKSADAARTEAERRWTQALHDRFVQMPVTYAEIIDLIDTAKKEGATDAEVKRRGAGLLHILRELRIPDSPASGFAPKGSRI